MGIFADFHYSMRSTDKGNATGARRPHLPNYKLNNTASAESECATKAAEIGEAVDKVAGIQKAVDSTALKKPENQTLRVSQLVGSALAAALGVQSSKNRERDFKQGRAATFIAVGLLFTLLFIGTVFSVVMFVLSNR
ncbi:MAG: DUF2970 domain-containing protein [Pseudomonadota bacterium]